MYILKYATKDQQAKEIKERLREMTLAYKEEIIPKIIEVTLFDETEEIAKGLEAIQLHLDELKGELHQWYYCNC